MLLKVSPFLTLTIDDKRQASNAATFVRLSSSSAVSSSV